MRLVKDLLFWLLWEPGRWLLWQLPLPTALAAGRWLGRMLCRVPTGARAAMERAAKVILGPQASPSAIREAARRGIVNLVANETEALLFPRLAPQNLACCMTTRGFDHLDTALELGRGALLVVAHFGANQMVMAAVGHSGRPICQISAPAMVLDDKMPGRRSFFFRAGLRRRWVHEQALPVTHINVFGPLTRALDCLRKGGILAVAVDGGHGANLATVPFLGRLARFNTGGLELAAHSRCPVLPVFVIRGSDGRNTMEIGPPLTYPGDATLSRKATAETLLRAYVPLLEGRVRRHPCHYLRFLAFRELMTDEEPFFEPEPLQMDRV